MGDNGQLQRFDGLDLTDRTWLVVTTGSAANAERLLEKHENLQEQTGNQTLDMNIVVDAFRHARDYNTNYFNGILYFKDDLAEGKRETGKIQELAKLTGQKPEEIFEYLIG